MTQNIFFSHNKNLHKECTGRNRLIVVSEEALVISVDYTIL
ncbi:hypothetical protein SAMN05444380_11437 [Thermophagus xiamenensis]|uniref:Uncharacterized protein n=1 Tax=Thermophagus xiamenensis TaxID=385682 RepID=A0A1I2BTU9_9BACT|nr:hypothetical protein SAMN05444380_11437 [Thermophagus xiamenensis]